MKAFLQRWIVTTVAVLVATHLVPRIDYDTALGLLAASLILGLLNAFIKPVLMVLSLPLLLATLGLFTLVINALLLYLVGQLTQDFRVESFGAAFWGALIISIVSLMLNSLTGTGNARVEVRRGPPGAPSPSKRDDDVIDV